MSQFSAVSNVALDDTRLNGPDILVLAALGYHTDKNGWCFPSQDTLAEKARLSRQTVSDSIRRLVRFGYVERHIPDNGDLSKIRYRRILDTARAPEAEETQPADLVAQDDKGDVVIPDKPLPAETTRVVAVADKACRPRRHKQEPLNQSKELEDRARGFFEEVWGPWERHRTARKLSRRGFGKARTFEIFKRKAEKTDPAIIRSAAFAHIKDTEPTYLEGFSVWLNAESYDAGENVVAIATAADWEDRVYAFETFNKWDDETWGPRPGTPGYRGPATSEKQGALL